MADDPSLNCRLEGVGGYGGVGLDGQPRPIVVDPISRWKVSSESKVVRLAKEKKGKEPWVITNGDVRMEKREVLEECGGGFICVETNSEGKMEWSDILKVLKSKGLNSVMIEGGANVINSLMLPENIKLVSSVIVTIAPTWLGKGGVVVSPDRRNDEDGKPIAATRLEGAKWYPLGEDVVLCGQLKLDG